MTAAPGANDGRLSIAIQTRIDRICLEFEDQWQADRAPRIEDFLGDTIEHERELLLLELLRLELDYLRDTFPGPDYTDYLTRFPQDGVVVRQAFEIPENDPAREYVAGDRIDRFEVQCKIGEGAFGVVYRAVDPKNSTTVALKVPHPRVLRRAESLQRFSEETRTLSRLNHESIVAFRDVVEDAEGRPVLVMEHIEGLSLREWMERPALTLEQSMELLAQVAAAIDYAHREGFVHRDLEPRNILIDQEGRPHITDFGLALHESRQPGRQGETAGSMAYMSPEQVRGEAHWLDGRADIWALGVILYELLTKRRPFRGRTLDELDLEIRQREPKPPRQINPQMSAEFERICLKCLSKSASDRYTTANDLATELWAALGKPQPRRRRPPLTTQQRRRWLWATLAGVSCLVLGVRQWLFHSSAREPVDLEGTLDVRVWRLGEPVIANVSVRDERFGTLRADNEVRFLIRVNRPAYIYILVIDSRGRIAVAYPWVTGVMRFRSPDPVIALSLPANQTWILDDGPRGMLTVMLLAGDAPLPSQIDLRTMLEDLEPQTGDPGSEAVFFSGKESLTMTHAVARFKQSSTIIPSEEGLQAARRNCELAREKLSVYFDLLVAVSMPFEGKR